MNGRSRAQQVREQRIRAGTRAPGPQPVGGADHPDLVPGPEETLDRLAGDFCLFQRRDGHKYSTDDLLCADLACHSGPAPTRALDLGCGIGSVTMLLAWFFPRLRLDGVEVQSLSVGLARRSARFNGVDHRVVIHEGDIRNSPRCVHGSFDLICATPPYYRPGQGKVSTMPQRGPCRFTLRGGPLEYLEAAGRHLHPEGRLAMVFLWADRYQLEAAAPEYGLALVSRQCVLFKVGKTPIIGRYLFRPGGPAEAVELPALAIRQADGDYAQDYRDLRVRMGFPIEGGFHSPTGTAH